MESEKYQDERQEAESLRRLAFMGKRLKKLIALFPDLLSDLKVHFFAFFFLNRVNLGVCLATVATLVSLHIKIYIERYCNPSHCNYNSSYCKPLMNLLSSILFFSCVR